MSEIAFETVGRAGLITFTRAKALNALSRGMIEAMGEALEEWAQDDRVERVMVRGEGKAFCAGGDVRHIYEHRDGAADYFAAEYRNNARVAEFPKPYVALIDGIVMGGGVGVSVHGSHRLGTERTMMAMPEVGIGLVPDIGSTHILANLPGHQGMWMALTGARLSRDEAAHLGLLTHAIDADRLHDGMDRVAEARDLDGALADLLVESEPLDADVAAFVEDAFGEASVAAILERLDAAAQTVEMAGPTAATMRTRSPTSMRLAFEAQRRHGEGDVRDALTNEYRVVCRILEGHDLFEGIRAVVIDKDNAPQWSPTTLEGVDEETVAAHFERPEPGDLVFAQAPVGAS